jgi:hypothetical protein
LVEDQTFVERARDARQRPASWVLYRSRRYSHAYRMSNCRFNSALFLPAVMRILS